MSETAPITTAVAQRRLLEALAGVSRPRGLVAGLYGAAETTTTLAALGGHSEDVRTAQEVAAVYRAVAELVVATTNEKEQV